MSNFNDLTGQKFSRLFVISRDLTQLSRRTKWVCKCECGNTINVSGSHLITNHTKSCGCLRYESKNVTHGFTKGRKNKYTKEYKSWSGMRYRCKNENSSVYKYYGGRGIKVCERWDDFALFLQDMGVKPSAKHSIERIDNNGNYEPSNCKWATITEQANNKRDVHFVEFNNKKLSISEWANITGIKSATLKYRIASGWPIEKTLLKKKQIGREITFNNETLNITQWAKKSGIPYHTFKRRLLMGWPIDKALNQKVKSISGGNL